MMRSRMTAQAPPRSVLVAVLLLGVGCAAQEADGTRPMTAARLEADLIAIAGSVDASGNRITLEYEGVELTCVFDPTHDRMRLIAPIARVTDLTGGHAAAILQANFHTALDARYGTSDGVLYAAFIHPLAALTSAELQSAVHQVTSLVQTFGSSYSSGVLQFGPGTEDAPDEPSEDSVEVPL